jgi:hypothetical protein
MRTSITSEPNISPAAKPIQLSGGRIEPWVHEEAVRTLAHIAQHGDATPALKLLRALPQGVLRNRLAAWYRQFSHKKVRIQLNTATGDYKVRVYSNRDSSDFDIDGARRAPFARIRRGSQSAGAMPQERAAVSKNPDMTTERQRYWKRRKESAKRAIDAQRKALGHVFNGGRVSPR